MEARVLSFRIHKTSLTVKHYSEAILLGDLEKIFGWCSYYFFFSFLLELQTLIRTQSKLITHMQVNLANLIHIWMDARVISFDLTYAYNADRVQIIFFSFLLKIDENINK